MNDKIYILYKHTIGLFKNTHAFLGLKLTN